MPFDRTCPFFSIDQDALNVMAMCCQSPAREIRPEGIDYISTVAGRCPVRRARPSLGRRGLFSRPSKAAATLLTEKNISLKRMDSVVCTLFENHYHHGIAALTNSLYRYGFRGAIYAGYRGSLPAWSAEAKENPSLALLWPGCRTLEVAHELKLHFLPVDTNYHLTNYKPEFMLRLYNGPAKDADAMAYFDPDIVVKCRWGFYESWMMHGVAVVHEVVSNDMPKTHPIRLEWEKVIAKWNRRCVRKLDSYINGGFCGIAKKNIEFLFVWSEIIEQAITDYKPDPEKFMSFDRTHPFFSIDQDALNVAAMCAESSVSEIGPEGMDLVNSGWTMSHAVGSPKPWKKNLIFSALKGTPPSLADREFWMNATGVIKSFSAIRVKMKRISISIAAFIGRFYSRR